MQRHADEQNEKTLRLLRRGGLIFPFIVAAYLLLSLPSVTGMHPASIVALLVMMGGWIVVGLLAFSGQDSVRLSSNRMMTWIGLYHLLLAMVLIYITGFDNALVFFWSFIMLMSFIHLGATGYVFSLVILILSGVVDAAVFKPVPLTGLYENSLFALVTIVLGTGAVGVTRTIQTDQREIENERQHRQLESRRLVTLINNLADPVFGLDQKGKISLYNAAALNLLDTNNPLDGQLIDSVIHFHGDDEKRVHLARELHAIDTVKVRDDLWIHSGGEIVRLELTISSVRSAYGSEQADNGGWIIIIRDITKSKTLEEERDEFIGVVSHELRTPITIAEGAVSNVQLMIKNEGSGDKVDEAIDLAHQQMVFLANMVNDLSTLSRAERGIADESEAIDVEELIHSIYHEYEPQAAEKGLQFDLHIPTTIGKVYTSRLYLKETLQNFVTNSLKYTHEGQIKLDVKKSRNGDVTFQVSDSGIGISKSDQKRIFEKFYRAEDYRTRETSGTGLGLYVASKLARKIGAKISMKSRLNHGSVFSLVVPANSTDTSDTT